MKVCSKCKNELDNSCFSKSNKEKSGLRNRCIKCEKEDYRLRHPFKDNSFENLPNEEWRDVVGYEEYYQISNLGRMCSKSRIKIVNSSKRANFTQFIPAKLRKITISKHPKHMYYQGLVSVNNVVISVKIHRLIAEAFIPNPDNKPHINHIDGNKLNNAISNLEWCTHKENMQHAWNTGLSKPLRGEFGSGAKLTASQVLEIRELSKTIRATKIAPMYGVHHATIRSIILRKTWK